MTSDRLHSLISSERTRTLTDAHFDDLPGYSHGKVRDSYTLPDGRRLMVITDRQSAFDQILAAVPFKGQVLNATARYWFEQSADIIANHTIAHPDPNVIVAENLQMLPVEVVVRGYLTGTTSTSIWPMYESGRRHLYGVTFSDGMRKNQPLERTIITPTTKGDAGDHDEPISQTDVVDRGLVSPGLWEEVCETALALFERGRMLAADRGLILVDTKYEFGIDRSGHLKLADEVHTPDSSRYWLADSYDARFAAGQDPEPLDKDFLRRWVRSVCDPYRETVPVIPDEVLIEFGARYIALYETVTAETFMPIDDSRHPRDRVRDNIQAYLQACV